MIIVGKKKKNKKIFHPKQHAICSEIKMYAIQPKSICVGDAQTTLSQFKLSFLSFFTK